MVEQTSGMHSVFCLETNRLTSFRLMCTILQYQHKNSQWVTFGNIMMLWEKKSSWENSMKGDIYVSIDISLSSMSGSSSLCVCLCLPAFLHPACKHRIRSLSKCACCRKLSSENISGKRLGSLLLCTSLHHMSLSEIFAVHRMRDEINPNAIFSPSCAFLKVAKIVLILAR